jgi:hypothetical protein
VGNESAGDGIIGAGTCAVTTGVVGVGAVMSGSLS